MFDFDNPKIIGANPTSILLMTQEDAIEKDLTREDAEWVPAEFPSGELFGKNSIKNKLRVLIFTPEHPRYGIHQLAFDSIRAAMQNYEGAVDWLISSGDNPEAKPFDNVLYQHNKARAIVLASDYDALMSIEADMIVPVDIIDKLIEAEADIAYGLYAWRHRPNRWSAYKDLTLWGGTSVSLDHRGNDVRENWGKIIDVGGLGMGCTLIKKRVLQRIEFRLLDGNHSWIQEEYAAQFKELGIDPYRQHRAMVCDDWLLAMDAQHYGFKQRCNLSAVCGHIDHDMILWPDANEKNFIRKENIKEH